MSHYLLNAMQAWSRELDPSRVVPYEVPPGLYDLWTSAKILSPGDGGPEIFWAGGEYDIEFTWEYDEKEEPNTGELLVYNLSDTTLRRIHGGDVLALFGGYGSTEGGLLAHSTVTEMETEWKGADKVTTFFLTEKDKANIIEAATWYDPGNGASITELAPGGASVAETYAAGVRASQILFDLIYLSGLPTMDVIPEEDRVYAEAVVVEGPLFSKIHEFARVCGCSAYMANGYLVVKNLAVNRASDRLLISQPTGLLEAPAPFAEEGDDEGAPAYRGYTAKMLGNARALIGAPVLLQSGEVNAQLTVLRGKHTYDGKDFLTEAVLVE